MEGGSGRRRGNSQPSALSSRRVFLFIIIIHCSLVVLPIVLCLSHPLSILPLPLPIPFFYFFLFFLFYFFSLSFSCLSPHPRGSSILFSFPLPHWQARYKNQGLLSFQQSPCSSLTLLFSPSTFHFEFRSLLGWAGDLFRFLFS